MLVKTISYAKELLKDDYDYSGFEIARLIYDEIAKENVDTVKEKKFVDKFFLGFSDRPSVKKNPSPKNTNDGAVDSAVYAILGDVDPSMLSLLRLSHRVLMASESIMGNLLLEYIHKTVRPYGWTCCWGNCLYGIDLAGSDGQKVHVRNKNTTEVSLNDRNRVGGSVSKWFRFNARNGKLKWGELNEIIGKGNILSEDGFRDFVYETVKKNPECLYTGEDEINALKTVYDEVVK